MAVHIGPTDLVRDSDIPQPTAEKCEEAIRTLEATQKQCQVLEQWAMRQLPDDSLTIPLCDLAQYCRAACLRCKSYLAGERPLLPTEFGQEQLWRGLEALGFDQNTNPTIHDTTMLDILLGECKQRTLEVLELLEKELDRISSRPEVRIPEQYDFQRLATAVTKVHENTILRSDSDYMMDKQVRVYHEAMKQILPSASAVGYELLKMASGAIESSPTETYPGETEIEKTLQSFLCRSMNWAESLQAITDPLNIQSYETINDAPYTEMPGAEVGAGSFGIVFRAQDTKTRTMVAIKRIGEIYNIKKQITVRKELSMLEICDHPNIVKLLDAYQISDQPEVFYLVMEPWAPYTLTKFLRQSDSQRCRDSPWFTPGSHRTERQVIRIFRGLADGLCYLHDKSIKHKDLKPDNILLYDDGRRDIRPIIADLGISKIFKSGNPTDDMKTTYAYRAPEQVASTGSTLRSDVWQLGCCFALLLAVFRHGSAGGQHLWDSFENTNEGLSCNIAQEAQTFLAAFDKLCGHGSASQRRAHLVTRAMLEINPESRFDMETVRACLDDL